MWSQTIQNQMVVNVWSVQESQLGCVMFVGIRKPVWLLSNQARLCITDRVIGSN
jgi:hypothetical protein